MDKLKKAAQIGAMVVVGLLLAVVVTYSTAYLPIKGIDIFNIVHESDWFWVPRGLPIVHTVDLPPGFTALDVPPVVCDLVECRVPRLFGFLADTVFWFVIYIVAVRAWLRRHRLVPEEHEEK